MAYPPMAGWPQSWLGRILWFMMAVAAGWIVYRVVVNYGGCRAGGTMPEACVMKALFWAWIDALLQALMGLLSLLGWVLP